MLHNSAHHHARVLVVHILALQMVGEQGTAATAVKLGGSGAVRTGWRSFRWHCPVGP